MSQSIEKDTAGLEPNEAEEVERLVRSMSTADLLEEAYSLTSQLPKAEGFDVVAALRWRRGLITAEILHRTGDTGGTTERFIRTVGGGEGRWRANGKEGLEWALGCAAEHFPGEALEVQETFTRAWRAL